MPVTQFHSHAEKPQPLEFSFELPDSDNLSVSSPADSETRHKRERRRRSSLSEIAVALVILTAAIVSSFGVNWEMVARQFPQLAAILHVGPAAQAQLTPTGPDAHIKVWVDRSSALYYCPGSPSYGLTRHGRYLSQAEALRANFEPAQRSQCTAQSGVLPRHGGTAPR